MKVVILPKQLNYSNLLTSNYKTLIFFTMKTMKPIIVLLFALSSLSVMAQERRPFGETEQDSINCIRNLSLYQEFFRQRNFIDAFEPWLQVLRTCPANSQNTFIRGVAIVKTKLNAERDPEKRRELLDLLYEIYDTRSVYFGNQGLNLSRKAIDMMAYEPQRIKDAYRMMERAVVELGVGNDHIAPFFFFEYAMANERAGNIDKEEVFEVYDIASSYLENILKAQPGDTQVLNTMANLDIAFEPYATCDEIVPIFERKWDDNKGDIVYLEKITRVLDHKDCNDSELFFNATEALHGLRPTPKSGYLMAKMLDGKRNYAGVIEYLRDNAHLLESDRDRVRAFLLLARAYLQEHRYREGREAALKALEINPNEGLAYILIGTMYASSSRNCSDDPQVGQRAVFWAAVDKFVRAREIDPNRAAQANELINIYRAQFPTGDDLFFQGISEGSSYRVGCWIQESTIVRRR
jgi:tetratricopeptide (TPR) repeat protein